jgi:aminopeptidase N
LEQKRFILIESNSSEAIDDSEEFNEKWWVPITFTTKKELNFENTKPKYWMKPESKMTITEKIDKNDWIILNPQVAHYYRVNYDAQNWKLIIQHLNNPQKYQEISPANRAQLIDDAMHLARAEILDYSVAMDVTKYLKHETSYVAWKTAINNLFYIDSMLIQMPDYNLMKVNCFIQF